MAIGLVGRLWLALFCVVLLCAGCDLYEAEGADMSRGRLLKCTWQQQISPLGYSVTLGLATDLVSVTIDQAVDLYRMEYASVDPRGEPRRLSALVGIPVDRRSVRGLVNFYHGTVFSSADAPSRSLTDGPLVAATFAGKGFLYLAPDYLGLTTGDGMPSYMMAHSTAENMLDALRALDELLALEDFGIPFPDDLYLSGASQGAAVAVASMKLLQGQPDPRFVPDAVAGVAGVYYLVNLDWQNPSADTRVYGFENTLEGDEAIYTIYMCQMFLCWSYWFGQDLETLLLPRWADVARAYLDGSRSRYDVYTAFNWEESDPADDILPSAVLQPAFLEAYGAYRRGEGPAPWIIDRIAGDFTCTEPATLPVRLYYGETDAIALRTETLSAAEGLGNMASIVSLGPYGHGSAILKSIPELQAWFLELSESD